MVLFVSLLTCLNATFEDEYEVGSFFAQSSPLGVDLCLPLGSPFSFSSAIMDFYNGHNNGASYPSRLVNNSDISQPETLQVTPNNDSVQANTNGDSYKRNPESIERDQSEEQEHKRQRTQASNQAIEATRQQMMDALNREAQKGHGPDAQVFPISFLQSYHSTDSDPAESGRGRSQINANSPVDFLAPTPRFESQPHHIQPSSSGYQQPFTTSPDPASGSYQVSYPQVQHYYNLPVPRSYPPTIPVASPAPIGGQQDKQSKQGVSETTSSHLTYPQGQYTPGPPVSTPDGCSKGRTPLPDAANSGTSQRQHPIASTVAPGNPKQQQKDLPRQNTAAPTFGKNQPYPFGPYPSYPDSLASQTSSTLTTNTGIPQAKATPRSRRAPRQPVNRNSPVPIASAGTPRTPYSTLQLAYQAPVPILGEIQPEGVRTPQKSFFMQGWG